MSTPKCLCNALTGTTNGCPFHSEVMTTAIPAEPMDEKQARYIKSMTPLTDEEIGDLLGRMTLHGPLPKDTMNRVFATIAEVPGLRQQVSSRTTTTQLIASAVRVERGRAREVLANAGFEANGNDWTIPAGIPDVVADNLVDALADVVFGPKDKRALSEQVLLTKEQIEDDRGAEFVPTVDADNIDGRIYEWEQWIKRRVATLEEVNRRLRSRLASLLPSRA